MSNTSRLHLGRRAVALAAAGALALSACGGSNDPSTVLDPDAEPADGQTDTESTPTDDLASDPVEDAPTPDDGATSDSEIAFLEPTSTIPVDLAAGDGVELAVSPDGAYVASVSSQNEVAPVRTLTTYSVATGEVVASVTAAEAGVIGSGPEWLADGRIVVRNGDTLATWTGPELEPAETVAYDGSACEFGMIVDSSVGASFALKDFADPPVLCRIDLTTGDVITAPAVGADRWFHRAAQGTVSLVVRGADDNSSLVTLDSTTLAEISSQPLDVYNSTNAGLLIGEDADTVLVPGDIPIPTGRLDVGARLSDNGRVLISGGGSEEVWLSTEDGSPIGQVEPGFATWQYGWSSDDSVVARPIATPDYEVDSIAVHVLG